MRALQGRPEAACCCAAWVAAFVSAEVGLELGLDRGRAGSGTCAHHQNQNREAHAHKARVPGVQRHWDRQCCSCVVVLLQDKGLVGGFGTGHSRGDFKTPGSRVSDWLWARLAWGIGNRQAGFFSGALTSFLF